MRGRVKLFYNDYNTYLISDDIVSMIKFVNEGGKICDGVGMQSHLDVHWPDANYIGNTIDKFKNAGFEIQIKILSFKLMRALGIRFISKALLEGAPSGARFLRVKVPNPPGSGKDIAEGKGVHREVESEGSWM